MVTVDGCRVDTMKTSGRHVRAREQLEDVRFPPERPQRVLHVEGLDEGPEYERVRLSVSLDIEAAHL
ncbi:hypothetical protein ACWERW_23005 [Streptomyces sp. NPDC004012]